MGERGKNLGKFTERILWKAIVDKSSREIFICREYFYTVENTFIQSKILLYSQEYFYTVENGFFGSRNIFYRRELFLTVEIIFSVENFFTVENIFCSREYFYTRESIKQSRLIHLRLRLSNLFHSVNNFEQRWRSSFI